MNQFAQYKPSGVDWLGKEPEHWGITRIKYVARRELKSFTDGDWIESPFITDSGIRLIQTGNVGIGVYKDQGFRYISEESFKSLGCTEIFPNDILICRLAAPVGRACFIPELGVRMITSVDNCILKPATDYDSRYLVYFFSTDLYLSYIETISRGGTRDRISRSMLGDIHLFAPPLSEQRSIARFLDDKTAKIDKLIEKKRRLIELLKEERQAVINHAVTKGLNSNAKMKPSGIEWLGDVPERWEVTKLKYHISVLTDFTANGSFAGLAENVIYKDFPDFSRVIRLTDLRENLDNSGIYVDEHAHNYLRKSELFGGEVLLANVGAYAGLVWRVPALTFKATLGPNMFLLKFGNGLRDDFAYLILSAEVTSEYLRMLAASTAQPKLNKDNVRSVDVVMPPPKEQKAIVDFVADKTKELDKLIEKAERAITLLMEYRTALITEAVTGREEVPLPATISN